jgi:hypothetical protein
MNHNNPKFEKQSHTIVLFTIILLAKVFTFEIKAQSYQFLIGNPAVTDTNTNYTLNAGLTRCYFDSLHAIDTSIHSFLSGEKAFKRYKYVMQDRIYNNSAQIGGGHFYFS